MECPVEPYTFMAERRPALAHWQAMDELQSRARPMLRTDEAQGYWVATDAEAILEGLQNPEVFSSAAIVPTEPNPPVALLPIMLDPPQHTKWRKVLGSYFSPGRVEKQAEAQRAFARELIEDFRAKGECDFYADFAEVFPTTIFLQILGLPIEHLPRFLDWERKILHATEETDPGRVQAVTAMMEVVGYFAGVIAEKRADPSLLADDIVSHALEWQIDGEKPGDQDLLSCMLLLFMAGLDTVAAQLSYAFHHLARHPADRAPLVADPSIAPDMVEEFLRVHPIVQLARKATRDVELHGCPVAAGDMVAFPLGMAGRDPNVYPDPTEFRLGREVTRHISFGAGPHRCLGSHLARQELTIVLQEWHALIPDYEISDESRVLEHAGGVYSIEELPLRWNV
ncbi:MAG TPA: cytochrome P450 [Mycobacteriales bacterium]|nr:cytochrome P450 [Mycobacteriales bacterium]